MIRWLNRRIGKWLKPLPQGHTWQTPYVGERIQVRAQEPPQPHGSVGGKPYDQESEPKRYGEDWTLGDTITYP